MLSSRQIPLTAAPQPSLPPFTQEDVLALIGWRTEAAEAVSWLTVSHFTQGAVDYQRIAKCALSFWEQFQAPPADHLYDLVLQQVSEAERPKWMQVLMALKDLAPRLNLAYVTERLRHYLHQADLKTRLYGAMQALQAGDTEVAEELLVPRHRVEVRPAALTLRDTVALELSLARREEDQFLAGIPDFDRWYIRPARKTLYLVMGPAKRGKSWWLTHIGKFALMGRARVAHITLEMPKEQVLQRYIQSLTASTKRPSPATRLCQLAKNDAGQVRGLSFDTVVDRPGLILPTGRLEPGISARVQKLAERMDLRIQDFPTRSLTIAQFEAYLTELERDGFLPDMVIVDYGDLFKVSADNYRLELRQVFEDLRRIACERNLSMVTATQTNRGAFRQRQVRADSAAEDFSKVMTADWILTLSQTEAERQLGVARVQATGRDEQDGRTVVISQNFALGQFCLDSAVLPSDWEQLLTPHTATTPAED